MKTIGNRKPKTGTFTGFTLIELLVVISIMGLLAALTFPALGMIKRTQYKKVAFGELAILQTALENYKAKYGAYPPGNSADVRVPQLYFELGGVTHSGAQYTTLDGRFTISETDVKNAYNVGGFINSSQGGGGDDANVAKNFLPDLKTTQFYQLSTNPVTVVLVTRVNGPDEEYRPYGSLYGGSVNVNPIRYRYPGVHNSGSYDLWIQLKFGGKTNLICNWSRQVEINAPLP